MELEDRRSGGKERKRRRRMREYRCALVGQTIYTAYEIYRKASREGDWGRGREGDAVREGTVRKGSSVSRGRNERKRKREKEKGIEKERRRDGDLSL